MLVSLIQRCSADPNPESESESDLSLNLILKNQACCGATNLMPSGKRSGGAKELLDKGDGSWAAISKGANKELSERYGEL
jgi:hypothetical protein